jgi:hypothetical protein
MLPHTNPLAIAREAQDMARKAPGDRAFKIMALAMMAVTTLAAGLGAIHMLWRDTFGNHSGGGRGRGSALEQQPDEPRRRRDSSMPAMQADGVDGGTERRWTRRAQQAVAAERSRQAHSPER